MQRIEIAELILERLAAQADRTRAEFAIPDRVPSAFVDDLLPKSLAEKIFSKFPSTEQMMLKQSIKEHKYVAAQMDNYDPLLEETVYAFQSPRVLEQVAYVTGLQGLEPDAELYAGGISLMRKGGYLRPHLDNSHDVNQARYRALNLLYYVTPGWQPEYGGHLQLWDHGPHRTPRTIPSLFNRLVLMKTNRDSWHSVNEVLYDGCRCCVSNYYFTKTSPDGRDYFHATSFRGERAGVADMIMHSDNILRTSVLQVAPKVRRNRHIYRRRDK